MVAASQQAGRMPGDSLVRGPKCSTDDFQARPFDYQREEHVGKFLVIQADEWRDHYQAHVVTQVRTQQTPPVQCGDRWTERLTAAAAQKIELSAKYCARQKSGFRTFLTLTLDANARHLLTLWDANGEGAGIYDADAGPAVPPRKNMGRMVTEFLNAAQVARKRGKKFPKGSEDRERAFEIDPAEQPIRYVWVAENPRTVEHLDAGPGFKENPHVHVMLDWGVRKYQFRRWAAWIEKLWGYGFAHLERIRKPASAAAYMAKAAAYMGKGKHGTQGLVRGNRYSISRDARAPKPRTVGIFYASWIQQAIKMGHEQRQAAKKLGLWFSRFAFGGRRAGYARFFQALKADGWKFTEPPPDLLCFRWVQRLKDNMQQWRELFADRIIERRARKAKAEWIAYREQKAIEREQAMTWAAWEEYAQLGAMH